MKELKLAERNNIPFDVVFFGLKGWSEEPNRKLVDQLPNSTKVLILPVADKLFSKLTFFKLIATVSKTILSKIHIDFLFQFTDWRSMVLKSLLPKLSGNYQLMIGHNPSTLIPLQSASAKNGVPYAFDVEDYHPGEYSKANSIKAYSKLFSKVLPGCAYITAASPLILKYTLDHVGSFSGSTDVINNYFPENEFPEPLTLTSQKLQFVWFSQKIGYGRGLESFLGIIDEFSDKLDLHLIGAIDNNFYLEYIKNRENVFIHEPKDQVQLNASLNLFDIGLALENSNANFNRDICLTNKLLSYYQSGLYSVVSPTMAQKQFIQANPLHGICLADNTNEELERAVNYCIENIGEIRRMKYDRWLASKKDSWEKESRKLLLLWKPHLN